MLLLDINCLIINSKVGYAMYSILNLFIHYRCVFFLFFFSVLLVRTFFLVVKIFYEVYIKNQIVFCILGFSFQGDCFYRLISCETIYLCRKGVYISIFFRVCYVFLLVFTFGYFILLFWKLKKKGKFLNKMR